MKILVTGGGGFLGSHVCEYYANKGEKVLCIDNLTKHELIRTGYDVEKARYYNYNLLKNLGVEIFVEDIRNKEVVMDIAKGCDYIIHTAAQPAMTISIENPQLDLTTNVIGTFNILEAAKEYKIPIVNCSTIHVYGNAINNSLKEGKERFYRKPVAISEKDPIMQGKLTPLHVSKRAAELYVQTYIDMYKIEAATFRLTGIYGPRQLGGEDHGWVANFAIKTLLKIPIKIFGTDKQVRDILYVEDAVLAFEAFYKNRISGIYNIGGGKKTIISLRKCLEIIKKITQIEQEIKFEPQREGDLWYFVSDITKAKRNLGWEPKILPEEGIKRLINWVIENKELFIEGRGQQP